MKKATQICPEVIERAVRIVSEAGSQYDSQWAAITSIFAKIGCTPETLRRSMRTDFVLDALKQALYARQPNGTSWSIIAPTEAEANYYKQLSS